MPRVLADFNRTQVAGYQVPNQVLVGRIRIEWARLNWTDTTPTVGRIFQNTTQIEASDYHPFTKHGKVKMLWTAWKRQVSRS